MHLVFLSAEQAPDDSRMVLQAVQQRLGFVPKLQAVMAHSPAALTLYAEGNMLLARSSLSAAERDVVFLVASQVNGCGYCLAAHSSGTRLPTAVVEAIRDGRAIAGEPRLSALQCFVEKLIENRGDVGEAALSDFVGAGYTLPQALDILVALSLKTLTNYTARLFAVPLDSEFAASP